MANTRTGRKEMGEGRRRTDLHVGVLLGREGGGCGTRESKNESDRAHRVRERNEKREEGRRVRTGKEHVRSGESAAMFG